MRHSPSSQDRPAKKMPAGEAEGPVFPRLLYSRSPEETQAIARELAGHLRGDETVFLIGELGAGKTVFTKGLAAGLGFEDVHQVCSPTFTLMNVYPARVPIYHFDLYRLSGWDDVIDLGFEDYLGEGVVVVEWAEKIAFPIEAIVVVITVEADDRRRIEMTRPGARGDRPFQGGRPT
jgi:tRNA threonylcarbamoyladenosine biosynthesis protein TsaE